MSGDACRGVFTSAGSRKPGETCDDWNCGPSPEGQVACSFGMSGATNPRVCQLQLRGAEGDQPCVATVDGDSGTYPIMPGPPPARGYLCSVADGLRCDEVSFRCVKLRLAGESCGPRDVCIRGHFCDSTQHLCQPSRPVGQECQVSAPADSCLADAYCEQSSSVCTVRLPDGSACQSSEQCRSNGCGFDGRCFASGLALVCGRP
jgi:hypothetical protein